MTKFYFFAFLLALHPDSKAGRQLAALLFGPGGN